MKWSLYRAGSDKIRHSALTHCDRSHEKNSTSLARPRGAHELFCTDAYLTVMEIISQTDYHVRCINLIQHNAKV